MTTAKFSEASEAETEENGSAGTEICGSDGSRG